MQNYLFPFFAGSNKQSGNPFLWVATLFMYCLYLLHKHLLAVYDVDARFAYLIDSAAGEVVDALKCR